MSEFDIEIRKLSPTALAKLSNILDCCKGWKDLMSIIPDPRNPLDTRYTVEHMNIIECSASKTNRTCTEILFDEWGTSGRSRPRLTTLRDLLVKAQLYRAEAYVCELLKEDPPERPSAVSVTFTQVPEAVADDSLTLMSNPRSDNEPVIYEYDFLQRHTKGFATELGGGGFGTVYLGELPNERRIAVKKLRSKTTVEAIEQMISEVSKLSGVSHKNILPLLGYCISPIGLCLVYDYIQNGSLEDYLKLEPGRKLLSWEERHKVALETSEGIKYLHCSMEKPLVHRDIKSANILLDHDLSPKICDFGLLRFGPPGNKTFTHTTTIVGTTAYIAPEAVRGEISTKMDVYSFGVVLLELVTGQPPYDQDREQGVDLIGYVEEVEDVALLIDKRPDPPLNSFLPERMFEIAMDCVKDRKSRPLIPAVELALRAINDLRTASTLLEEE